MLPTIVVLLAVFIPAGPLTLDSHWSELMQDIQAPILKHLALVFNALGHGLRPFTSSGLHICVMSIMQVPIATVTLSGVGVSSASM